MQGYELKFNVYANSQAEADATTTAIKSFISELAARGVAVSATKLSAAISKWKNNPLIINYFK